ncbi:MAG: nickel-binding protein [Thermodesulfobacteriota bacterium]
MAYYLAVHYEPKTPRDEIEARWVELADEKNAIWLKTWFNFAVGKRFCWWDAPDKDTLERIFRDHAVPWEEIIEVEQTTPAEWWSRED